MIYYHSDSDLDSICNPCDVFLQMDSSFVIVQAINQPAVICYTSGTTANPKGVLLSQVVLMICAIDEIEDLEDLVVTE